MQITINKKAWHYRWYKFIYTRLENEKRWSDPKSVCSYFWGFIFVNLGAVLISVGGLLMAVFAIYMITSPIWYQFAPEFAPNNNGETLPIVGGILDGILLLFLAVVLISKKETGFIAVIKAYLWGLKNKVCPMITYEEE